MTTEEWNKELDRLEDYFKTNPPKTKTLKLQGGTITNLPKYIDTNIFCARANAGNNTFSACITRLQQLEKILNGDA